VEPRVRSVKVRVGKQPPIAGAIERSPVIIERSSNQPDVQAVSATIVDGRAVAAELRAELATHVTRDDHRREPPPSLAVVLCGDDPASAIYVRNKGRAAERAGVRFTLHRPPAESTTEELVALVPVAHGDDTVDAILVQLPLPSQIDPDAVASCISPEKDADGFHPYNFGASPRDIPVWSLRGRRSVHGAAPAQRRDPARQPRSGRRAQRDRSAVPSRSCSPTRFHRDHLPLEDARPGCGLP